MSVTPYGRLLSIGGFLEYCYSNSYIFTDATSNDLFLYTDYIDQNIVFGTYQGLPSAMRITSNEVQFNHHLYVNHMLSIGASNIRNYDTKHKFLIQGDADLGPHIAYCLDSNYPLFQQLNTAHDDITMSFDSFWNGSNWISSANNNFQIKKYDGRLLFQSSCNYIQSNIIDWSVALAINSNSFLGIATSNPTHRITVTGPKQDLLGPHMVFNIDDTPSYQHLNWDHDSTTHTYDAYYSNNWFSTSSNGNVQIQKQNGRYMIHTACNNNPGDMIDDQWRNAFTVNSNSFIGIGTSNLSHNRITIAAEDSSDYGPHTAIYTNTPNALYQQLAWTHDKMYQSYDAYFMSNAWYSSSCNANFRVQKFEGKYEILSSCNNTESTEIIDWRTALSIASNSYLGIGSNNYKNRITITAEDSSVDGPHIIYYTDTPIFQQLNWTHDDIHMSFDSYFESNQWISTSEKGNFKQAKKDGHILFQSTCNTAPNDPITWRTALAINSNSYVSIGDSNPINRFTMRAENESPDGPHFIVFTDSNYPLYQQLNWKHDDISMNFDSYFSSNKYISSDSNVFQIHKYQGQLSFKAACNLNPSDEISWRTAFAINSNSFISIGCNISKNRITIAAEDSSEYGPHTIVFTDSNPLYQQLNWTHDDIAQSFDAYYESNLWISSHSNSFKFHKKQGKLVIDSAFQNIGDVVQWSTALAIESNSYIGIGMSNPTHRLTLKAQDPHIAIYTDDKPLYQQYNSNHSEIYQNYDCYLESNILYASDSNIFQIQKSYGHMLFKSSCNHDIATQITDTRVAFSIQSNSFISIGSSNATHRLTMVAEDSNMLGPHLAYYTNNEYPLFQQLNWSHDDIHMSFDASFGESNWISSVDGAAYKISKTQNKFIISSSSNQTSNTITWTDAFSINSNSFIGINTLDATHRITMRGLESNLAGPHVAYYTENSNICYQHLNWTNQDISSAYNAWFDGENWISSSNTANFRIHYEATSLNIDAAHSEQSNITWSNALSINSNSYVGIGHTNPTHRLSVVGPKDDTTGPHAAFYFDSDTDPVLQIVNNDYNSISMNFDAYYSESNYISSIEGTAFQIQKTDDAFYIKNNVYGYKSSNTEFSNICVTINSNGYFGLNIDPERTLDVNGHAILRENLYITGNIIPNSNAESIIGDSNNRFDQIWLSSNGIDMDNLKLLNEEGGLYVYSDITNAPARLWAKEFLVGNPYDLFNSNVFLMKATSNGVVFTNVTSNIEPQDYVQTNNLYVTTLNVGIGLSNPEKNFQVNGDVEFNPNENYPFDWSDILLRLDKHDLLNNINNSKVFDWGIFKGSNNPLYFYNKGSPYIECTHEQSYFYTLSNFDISGQDGFAAFMVVRFNRDPQSNETIISFSNNNSYFKVGRHENTNKLIIDTKETSYVTSNVIMQNQWNLFSVHYDTSNIEICRNGSNIGTIHTSNITNMYFTPGIELGNANIDISSFYLFQRSLTKDEFQNLTRKLVYPGHMTFQIKTNNRSYPPADFYMDLFGWEMGGMSHGFQIYEKNIQNSYYGNGVYKLWSTDSIYPITYAFNNLEIFDWVSSSNYTNIKDSQEPSTIYMELPMPIKLQSYCISTFVRNNMMPMKWRLYGSTNSLNWIELDIRESETQWNLLENRTYYCINATMCKFYKFEIFRNNSPSINPICINSIILYGNDSVFAVDGSGVGINTPYPTKALTVEGEAYISNKLTVGDYDDSLKLNTYEYPHAPLTSITNTIDDHSYTVTESSYYMNNINYKGYRAFTKLSTDAWTAATNKYNPNYTGSISMTADGTTISGEWLQIQISDSLKLSSYRITPSTVNSAPSEFYILGSKDNTTWHIIDHVTHTWTNTNPYMFNIINDIPEYTYLRLITTKIGSSGTVSIGDLTYYGSSYNRTVGFTAELLVRGSLQSTNLVVAPEQSETLFDCTMSKLKDLYNSNCIIKKWDKFSAMNDIYPTYHNDYVYMPYGCYMDAGSTYIPLSEGFTIISLAKFHTNTDKSTLLCMFDDTNEVCFAKPDNSSKLRFEVVDSNVRIIDLSMDIEEDAWHVYTVKYDPIASNVSTYIDKTRKQFKRLSSQAITHEYPQIQVTDSNFALSNLSYGNGVYEISASVGSNILSVFQDNNDYWNIKDYYNASYLNSNVTRTTDMTPYRGEWIQLQLPESINLTSYMINTNATSWSILGSLNGFGWYLIDQKTNTISNSNMTFNITNENDYSYYRLVLLSGTNTLVNNWKLFSIYSDQLIADHPFTFNHAYIGKTQNINLLQSRLSLGALKVWKKPLSESELYREIDSLYSSTSVYIDGDVRLTKGIKGDLEMKSVNSYSLPTYVYPPSDMQNTETIMSGQYYGNGTYITRSSTNQDLSYCLFDNKQSTYWISDITYSNNLYIGNKTTNLADGTYLKGEWLDIELPNSIVVKYYTFIPRLNDYDYTNPKSWQLLGSDDSATWYNIGSTPQTDTTWVDMNEYFTVYLNNTKPYKSYRFVFLRSRGETTGLQEIKFYGQISTSMGIKDTSVVVFDKIGVNTTEPAAALHVSGFSVLSGLKIVAGNASNVNVPANPGGLPLEPSSYMTEVIGYSNEPTGTMLSIPGNTSSYAFRFVTGSTSNEVARINGLGNMGLNADPTEKLEVSGNLKVDSNAYILNNLAVGRSNPEYGLHVTSDCCIESDATFKNTVSIEKSNLEWSVWTQTVKTNNVSLKLGTASGKGLQIDTGSQVDILQEPYMSEYYSRAALECYNADYGTLLYVRNDGKVGIGTSNVDETLEIVGSFSMSNHGKVIMFTSNDSLGINNPNPLKTLDIAGDINITGDIYKNGVLMQRNLWTENTSNVVINNHVGINCIPEMEGLSVSPYFSISNYGKTYMYTSNRMLGINTSNISETLTIYGKSLSLNNNGKAILYGGYSNIGINVSDPRYTLDVGGDINFTGNLVQNGTPLYNNRWKDSNSIVYYTDGYVGIGISNPSTRLHVGGDITTQNVLPFQNTNTIGSATQRFRTIYGYTIDMNDLTLSRGIDNSLQLKDSNLYGALSLKMLQIQSNTDWIKLQFSNGVLAYSTADGYVSAIPNVYCGSNKLSIGTSNLTDTLSVLGTMDFNGFKLNASSNYLVLSNLTGLKAVMPRIVMSNYGQTTLFSSNSYLGINQLTPAYALDINGDMNLTGNIYINGIAYSSSKWSSSADGIYSISNIGIGGTPGLNALQVFGTLGLSNTSSLISLKTTNNMLGLNTIPQYTFTVGGETLGLSNYGYTYMYASNSKLGLNTMNVDYADFNIPGTLCFSNNGYNILYSKTNKFGINVPDPLYNLDVSGDINITGTYYKNGAAIALSKWTSNLTGIYVNSNIGIGGINSASYALMVTGSMGLSNLTGIASIYTKCNLIGINTTNIQDMLTINGPSLSLNNGTRVWMYANSSNLGLGKSNALFSLDILGDLNLTGAYYLNGNPLNTSKWTSNTSGIYVKSNIGINGLINTAYALTVSGAIGVSNLYGIGGIYTSNMNFGINTSNIVETLTINGPSLSLNGGSTAYLYANSSNLGINKKTAAYALDVNGDINMTGFIFKNGAYYQNSRWSCNITGAWMTSNIGIQTTPHPNYALNLVGDINYTGILYNNGVRFNTTRWSCNDYGIWSMSNIAIGYIATSNYALNVKGDINIDGTIYSSNLKFQGTRWSCNIYGIYYESNIALGTKDNSNYALNIKGDLNIDGTIYSSNIKFQTTRWSCNQYGIYSMSNIAIGAEADSNYALSVRGDIKMIDRGLKLRGLQIAKNTGYENNFTQQITHEVRNIPGLSNNGNNLYFYNGLYMKGLRLSAGDPNTPKNVLYASCNIQGYTYSNKNILFHIEDSNIAYNFKFLSGALSNQLMILTADGKLGLNTSPSYSLQVASPSSNAIRIGNDGIDARDFYITTGGQLSIIANDKGNSTFNTLNLKSGTSGGVYLTSGGSTWTSLSDRRLKKNIEAMTNGLHILNKLNPVSYSWNTEDIKRYGFIAQEVQKIIPEIVSENNDVFGLSMTDMIPFIVRSIQEISYKQNLTYTTFKHDSDEEFKLYDIIGFNMNGKLTNKFNEALTFCISAGGKKVIASGKVTLPKLMECYVGDYLIPTLLNTEISYYVKSDERILFDEYKLAIGKIIKVSENTIDIFVKP